MKKKTYNTDGVGTAEFKTAFFRRATDDFALLKSLFDTFDDVTFNIITIFPIELNYMRP